LRTNLCK